jgi:hypothetical protein
VATEPKTVHVTSGGELARLVEAANEALIILEKDGIRYLSWLLCSSEREARGNDVTPHSAERSP